MISILILDNASESEELLNKNKREELIVKCIQRINDGILLNSYFR